ncbi:hypothetical protein BV455_01994 [Parageobacillus caldoxylosilyticus]|uniref:lipopolysaccharide biosynthesis protein n=1 Tax=Saccharococcus caldoxylosilyticus TaxID=81408 RepID=UPI001C4E144B|nr:polysaccharide biosynthesis C-terminal domain-containing protein [Parageobacillus caldoxylosilyticus]QXJ38650.1 hypothetical protein BV455_01994 [Parageobacillus caldoxylosilyticus]
MRTKKALYTFISSIILQITTIMLNIITYKFFLEYYGSAINGLNAAIMQALTYMNLVEAGVGMASIQALYGPLAKKDYQQINGIMSATKKFYIQSGVIFCALLVSLSIIFPFIIKGQVPAIITSLLVLILGGGSIVEFFMHGKYRVLLTADQKGYVLDYTLTAATVISALLRIFLMIHGFNVLVVQFVSTLIYIMRVAFLRIYVKKNYPKLNFYTKPNTKAIEKRWAALFHQIAGLIVFNTDILVITIFCGLMSTSVYSTYNLIYGTLISFIWLLARSTTSGFGELIVTNDNKTLNSAFSSYEYLFYIIVTWIYSVTFIMIIPFIMLYTSNVHDINYIDMKLAVLFTMVGVANCIRVPTNTLIISAGHFAETKYRALAEAAINLSTSLLLVHFLGIYGVLVGTVISFIYRTIDTIIYSNRKILKRSIRISLVRIIRNIILGIMVVIISSKFIHISTDDWFGWSVKGVLCSILALFIITLGNAIAEPIEMKSLLTRILRLASRIFRFKRLSDDT